MIILSASPFIMQMSLTDKANNIIKSNLSQSDKALKLCELVRDIPYKTVGLDPSIMLKEGKGSCTPKHIFLAECLNKIGIPTKFLIVPFYYKNLNIKYPVSEKPLIDAMPLRYHICLKAKIKERWIIIDVTWDPGLKGFPVSRNLDLSKDMMLAVTPEEITEIESDPREFKKEMAANLTSEERGLKKKFNKFFNKFLIDLRK